MKKTYRFLGNTYSEKKLYKENPELHQYEMDINDLKIQESIGVMPRYATKAYQVARIK